MRKAFRISLTFLLLLFPAYLFYVNVKLFYQPQFETIEKSTVNVDLLKQLRYLERRIHEGEDEQMQQLFPEGKMFMDALYGLSWSEMAAHLDRSSALYKEAYRESYWCFTQMNTDHVRNIFPENLALPYGAFYNGWSAYHMAKLLATEDPAHHDSLLGNTFKQRCAAIDSALRHSATPYLESYRRNAWPADNMLCLAALSEHDKLFPPLYTQTIRDWVGKVRERLDPKGLLPHKVSFIDGTSLNTARGCSMSLMLCFLKSIDSSLYREQYMRYRENFLTTRFGLPGIREYTKFSFNMGDADSGPVIFGIGSSASIVGVRVLAGERAPEAVAMRNSIEAFGMSVQGGKEKEYLFGTLPMADAFIAWVNSTEQTPQQALGGAVQGRGGFFFYSLLMVLPFGFFIYRAGQTRSVSIRGPGASDVLKEG